MGKKPYRHKLLLDENLPPRQKLPILNELFDLKHIDHDLKHSGAKDPVVYSLGVSLGRIILTKNTKHFRVLAKTRPDCGVIAIPPHWPFSRVDSTLAALLKRHGPAYFAARVLSLDAPEDKGAPSA